MWIIDQTNTEEDKQKRKYAKRKDRKRAIIQILDTISSSLQSENVERNSIYFQNPFMVDYILLYNHLELFVYW